MLAIFVGFYQYSETTWKVEEWRLQVGHGLYRKLRYPLNTQVFLHKKVFSFLSQEAALK